VITNVECPYQVIESFFVVMDQFCCGRHDSTTP